MVERHIISPSAGRMRPNTSESGIFSTKRNSPVSTSMLTRMLVPNPKNAFQSPGVHKVGRVVPDVIAVITRSYRSRVRYGNASDVAIAVPTPQPLDPGGSAAKERDTSPA